MKRQRFVNGLLAVACVIMTGVTLRQYSIPMVPSADAQGESKPSTGPNLGLSPDMGAMKPAPPAVRKAVAAAIRAQLQAFAKGDYQAAIQYQSLNLRRNFPSVDRFRQMITTTYPEFAHYKTVKFTGVRGDAKGDHALVQIILTGKDGVTISAVYLMIREGGAYKVDGVGGGNRPPLPAAPGTAIDA